MLEEELRQATLRSSRPEWPREEDGPGAFGRSPPEEAAADAPARAGAKGCQKPRAGSIEAAERLVAVEEVRPSQAARGRHDAKVNEAWAREEQRA